MRHFKLTLIAFALAACGDNAVNNMQDMGIDSAVPADLLTPVDHAVPPDIAVNPDFSGLSCGTQTCTGSDVCCVTQNGMTASYTCAPSCQDGGITLGCEGPDNCRTGNANICCANVDIVTDPTGPGGCGLGSAVAGCTSTCTPSETIMQPLCPVNWTVPLCHRKSDCANFPGYTDCCLFTFNGNQITFCANQFTKQGATSCAP